jgi:tetratricopeptide (TPR) repeat protein
LVKDLPETTDVAASAARQDGSIALPVTPASISVDQLREESEQVVSELIRRYPTSSMALHIAAAHYAAVHEVGKAANLWRRCIELAPSSAGPRVGLATTAMERGDDAGAIQILEEALAAGCHTQEVYVQMATALQKLARLDEAERRLKQGLELFPRDVELWSALGQVQLQQSKLQDAEASLREAVRLRPDAATAHFSLATLYAQSARPDLAAEHRRRFAELRSEHPVQPGRFQEVYEGALRNVVVDALSKAAAEYHRQGESNTAEDLYLRALELNPQSAVTCRWLVSLLHRQGRFGDALLAQRRLVEIEPGRVENHLNLASLAAQFGDYDAAETALMNAARTAPQSEVAYIGLARLGIQRGQFGQARQFAEQAVQLAPSPDTYLILAEACERLGDQAGMRAAASAASQLAPRDPGLPDPEP